LRRDEPVRVLEQQLVAEALSGRRELNHDDCFIVSRGRRIAEGWCGKSMIEEGHRSQVREDPFGEDGLGVRVGVAELVATVSNYGLGDCACIGSRCPF
jgi:hypothetical protein